MRKAILFTSAVFISMTLVSCAPAPDFKSEADERLYRSIEQNAALEAVIKSVADGASIDKLKRGRLVSLNMVEFAAQNGREDIAQWLIDNGADVNYKTSIMGETLLMSMAKAGQYSLCELLLGKGADINAKDRLSDTALEYALKADSSISEPEIDKLVTLLLENGAKIRNETLIAVLSGYTGRGEGDCRYGLVLKIARLLNDSGGDVKLRPALKAAVLGNESDILSTLTFGELTSADRRQILFYTTAFGTEKALMSLADKGFDLKSADSDGNTLLILAARYGNTETAGYLLSTAQDLSAKNRFGKTALDEAAPFPEIVIMLEANLPSLEVSAIDDRSVCGCCRCGCETGSA